MNKLRFFRLALGLSQDQLSKLINMSQSKLSRAENGFMKFSNEEKQKLAEIFKCKLEQIFPED